jgi:hypothetical protein
MFIATSAMVVTAVIRKGNMVKGLTGAVIDYRR